MILLTSKKKNYMTIISDEDADLSKYNWTRDNSNGYFYRIHTERDYTQYKVYLHEEIGDRLGDRKRIIGECVDHINGNKNDNRRSNLRIVTQAQNNINKNPLSKRTNTGFTGIYENKDNSFTVKVGKKTVGKYDSIEEALYARIEYIYSVYKIDIFERVRTAAGTKEIYI